MPLSLTQLRVFEAITRAGSFTKAAERLAVTAPAVSLQIRQLERRYGLRLFERVRRRVRLTPAGEVLRLHAQRIFKLAEDAERALEHANAFDGARLRVAATPTTAAYYSAPLLKALRTHYPGLHLDLSVQNSRRVTERLLELEDDLGMLGGDAEESDLVFELLAKDPMVFVVAPDHPWARRRTVALRELAGQPLILRELGSAGRDLVERRLRAAGIEPRVIMEIASTEAIKRAVESGVGVSLLSAAVVRRDVAGGHLRALAVRDGRLVLPLHLAYHRERRESPLIRAVMDVLRPLLGRPAVAVGARGRLVATRR